MKILVWRFFYSIPFGNDLFSCANILVYNMRVTKGTLTKWSAQCCKISFILDANTLVNLNLSPQNSLRSGVWLTLNNLSRWYQTSSSGASTMSKFRSSLERDRILRRETMVESALPEITRSERFNFCTEGRRATTSGQRNMRQIFMRCRWIYSQCHFRRRRVKSDEQHFYVQAHLLRVAFLRRKITKRHPYNTCLLRCRFSLSATLLQESQLTLRQCSADL